MAIYRVTVDEVTTGEDGSTIKTEVYMQVVEDVSLRALIGAVNARKRGKKAGMKANNKTEGE